MPVRPVRHRVGSFARDVIERALDDPQVMSADDRLLELLEEHYDRGAVVVPERWPDREMFGKFLRELAQGQSDLALRLVTPSKIAKRERAAVELFEVVAAILVGPRVDLSRRYWWVYVWSCDGDDGERAGDVWRRTSTRWGATKWEGRHPYMIRVAHWLAVGDPPPDLDERVARVAAKVAGERGQEGAGG